MRSLTKALATIGGTFAAAAVALSVAASPAAASEWHTDGRYAWGACDTIELTLDASTVPAGVSAADVRADLQAGIDEINAAAGRTLVTLSAGSAAGHHANDGVNTVRFVDLPGAAGRASTTTGLVDGEARYVDALIELDGPSWDRTDRRYRVVTIAHELGHVLGLGHVADAHEVMSYGFVDDGDGLGHGTAHALRTLYPGTDCGSTVDLASSDAALNVSRDRARVARGTLGSFADDVRDLAVDVNRTRAALNRETAGWAERAVICRDDVFADCLGGSALAGADGVLLFVPGGANGTLAATDRVVQNLDTMLRPGASVYVLGGTSAVSESVAATLSVGRNVTRLAGKTRFETAAVVAAETVAVHGTAPLALVARADNPADAVTAGAVAARKGYPILLTGKGSLHGAAAAALEDLGISRSIVLGGEAALSSQVVSGLRAAGQQVERVAGATRVGTAVAIAEHADLGANTTLTDGEAVFGLNGFNAQTWALALAAAPFAASLDAPILLTGTETVPAETAGYLLGLEGDGTARAYFVGGSTWADTHAQNSFLEYASIR